MPSLEPVTTHRSQLYLPASLYRKIKERIKEEDISMAEFIRRLIKKELRVKEIEKEKEKERAWQKFLAAAGIGTGPKDLSYNHDRYLAESLWEEDRRKKKEYLKKRKRKK